MNAMETIGIFTPDSLIGGSSLSALVKGVELAPGQGVLKRGSLLCITDDGAKLYGGGENITPDSILTDDTDTGTDAEASDLVFTTAYATGEFAEQRIITAEGYSLSDADKTELRKLGIFLSRIMEREGV